LAYKLLAAILELRCSFPVAARSKNQDAAREDAAAVAKSGKSEAVCDRVDLARLTISARQKECCNPGRDKYICA
jgi:hypothetical protein